MSDCLPERDEKKRRVASYGIYLAVWQLKHLLGRITRRRYSDKQNLRENRKGYTKHSREWSTITIARVTIWAWLLKNNDVVG